jgi:hypothetical protein
MTIHLGAIPASSTLYIPFATYGKTNGESITLTGLAATDIEIYKNGSVTQRSSDAGYTLLDTDGIDFDGITGIHGFSVDLSDNTDSGFYSVGGFYWVVVSAVTIDSQTVNFIAATFRIVAAEHTAGYPVATIKDGTGTGELDTSSGGVIVASIAANAITASALAADAGAEIADAILDRDMSTGTDSGSTTVRTARQALRFIRNKWAIAAGTLTVYKEDDSTSSWTASVSTDAAADPVIGNDPGGP